MSARGAPVASGVAVALAQLVLVLLPQHAGGRRLAAQLELGQQGAQAAPGEQVQQEPPGPTEDAYGNPIPPQGPKKKFFLDWLLN